MDTNLIKSNPLDETSQMKMPSKKLITMVSSEVSETEEPEGIENIKSVPVNFKCGVPQRPSERNMSPSASLVSFKGTMDATDYRSTGKDDKVLKSNKMKFDDYPPDTLKQSVIFRPPAGLSKDIPCKKITIRQPMVIVGQERHVELSGSENKNREDSCDREPGPMNSLHESRIHEKRVEGRQKAKKKIMEKRKPGFADDAPLDHRPYTNERRVPERHRASKQRRGGEVQFLSIHICLMGFCNA